MVRPIFIGMRAKDKDYGTSWNIMKPLSRTRDVTKAPPKQKQKTKWCIKCCLQPSLFFIGAFEGYLSNSIGIRFRHHFMKPPIVAVHYTNPKTRLTRPVYRSLQLYFPNKHHQLYLAIRMMITYDFLELFDINHTLHKWTEAAIFQIDDLRLGHFWSPSYGDVPGDFWPSLGT